MPNTDPIIEDQFRVGILTISDSGFKGERETDVSGDTIAKMIMDSNLPVVKRDMAVSYTHLTLPTILLV